MRLVNKKIALTTPPFTVEEVDFEIAGKAAPHPYFRLACPDWVNVLPITADGRAILIKQPRAGSAKYVLETPGGVIDPGERDPTMAALRELEEETGFTSQRILPLASINPNPAVQTNRCHLFLALNCHLNPTRRHFPDPDESIEVHVVDVNALDGMVRTGEIDHALAALCIMLAQKYLRNQHAKV